MLCVVPVVLCSHRSMNGQAGACFLQGANLWQRNRCFSGAVSSRCPWSSLLFQFKQKLEDVASLQTAL